MEENAIFAIVGNIPAFYHSSDLRNYFSQFIESSGFDCFHFRHRPELQRANGEGEAESRESQTESETQTHSETQTQSERLSQTQSQSQSQNSHTHTEAVGGVTTQRSENHVQSNDASVEFETPGCADVNDNNYNGSNISRSSQHSSSKTSSASNSMKREKTMCCIVKVKKKRLEPLLKMYHLKRWLDRNGESMNSLCVISRIKLPEADPSHSQQYKTRKQMKQKARYHDGQQVNSNDLKDILELHPPTHVMPQGNVGTPTLYFLRKIQACRLPQNLIGKLGLKFPKHRAKRMYGDVPYNYGGVVMGGGEEEEEEVKTADGHAIVDARVKVTATVRDDVEQEEDMEAEKVESEEDADDCEEWERHEALNDDPSNAERNKERCFEEEMEVVWEKGGSGLVWYTDAQFWKEKEGDFDEQTTDDLDVDMSVYYEATGGDKDARDFVMIQRDIRRRQGISEDLNDTTGRIGKFEKHTRGFGRQLMERQGWQDGKGLGPSVAGIADAVDSDGQKPRDKTGFGYRGEKLQLIGLRPQQRKPDDQVIISTIYDNPDETDPPEELIRRREPHHITHRAGAMRFHKAFHPDEPV